MRTKVISVQRKQIRNYIVSRLKLTRVINNGNVAPNRVRPSWTENLPAINVRVEDDEVAVTNESPKEFTHRLDVAIEIFEKSNADEADLSDKLDDIAERVEESLFADEYLGGLVNSIDLTSFGLDIKENGSQLQGGVRQVYRVEYKETRPKDRFNQDLDDLNTVHATYEQDDNVEEPTDTISFNT